MRGPPGSRELGPPTVTMIAANSQMTDARRQAPPDAQLARAGALAALALCLILAACTAFAPAPAGAASGDEAATSAYVEADLRLMHSAVNRTPESEAAINGVLRGVRADCPRAAAASPQNAQSTQLSNEVIGAMVMSVVAPGLPLAKPFVRATEHLRWSSGSLTREIGAYVGHLRTLTQLAPPHLCSDIRSWAASGFQALPASTVSFDRRFLPAWVAAGYLPRALARFENGSTRALARRVASYENAFVEFEAREIEQWGHIMSALELWP